MEAGGLAIEIARLHVELRRQLTEVEASRARIVAAGYAERRRIERDLHDGAQQRLVSIGLELRHVQHQTGADLDGRADARRSCRPPVAIDELRELAQGLPPSQLDAGLEPALRELAGRSPLPVEVRATRERFSTGLEATAYFIACEGLTNAIKHARASTVTRQRAPARRAARRLRARRRRRRRDRRLRHSRAPRPGAAHGGALHIDSASAGTDPDRGAAVRVVIVEDQVLLREGLARLFADSGHEVVASLPDATACSRPPATPDLVVLDIRMPPTFTDEGARAAAEIKRAHPTSACSCSPSTSRPHMPSNSSRSAASATCSRTACWRSASSSKRPSGWRAAARRSTPRSSGGCCGRDRTPLAELSEREREVLELMAEGLTNSGIAKRLFLSERTVEAHVRHVLHQARHPRARRRPPARARCTRASARER